MIPSKNPVATLSLATIKLSSIHALNGWHHATGFQVVQIQYNLEVQYQQLLMVN